MSIAPWLCARSNVRLPKVTALLVLASVAGAQVHRASYVPGNDAIRAILRERVDDEQHDVGIVVGVIDRDGPRVVSYGGFDPGDPRRVDGDTIFEIGSLTKVFTALLLTEMVERGEAALADPLSKYLPVPGSMTLQQLATNTSGLPRNPANLVVRDRENPFAGYTRRMLLASLPSSVHAHWEYSNLGYGLLGQALAPDYDRAIRVRIAGPLGMNSTCVTPSAGDETHLAIGHDEHFARMPQSDFGALAAAAGLHSSANDLLKLLAAFLGYTKTSLSPAMAATLEIRTPTSRPGLVNALGWQISIPDGLEIAWKDGTTAGFTSFLGYNRKAGVGVVVLSNTATNRGVNDIGMHLLDSASPFFQLPHRAAARIK
jgi:D-alanyl-D-alanine-carboxypeptidase/D-alanyl-D-alanine-endopeptidase